MAEIRDKVVAIVCEKLGVKPTQVVPEATFAADLGADSLDTVELVMELEKAFEIHVSDADAEHFHTVGDVITYIEKNI